MNNRFPFVSIIHWNGWHYFFNFRAISMWVYELPPILRLWVTTLGGYIYPYVSVCRRIGICIHFVQVYKTVSTVFEMLLGYLLEISFAYWGFFFVFLSSFNNCGTVWVDGTVDLWDDNFSYLGILVISND